MNKLFGERVLERQRINQWQLDNALRHQEEHGGRLGLNMAALGYIHAQEIDTFFKDYPKIPETMRQTGLDFAFVFDLITKHAFSLGEFTLGSISDSVKLPFHLVEKIVERLLKKKFLEIIGVAEFPGLSYRFSLTGHGVRRANELFELCRYCGPAPVTFDDYKTMVEIQTIKSLMIDESAMKKAFSTMVLDEKIISKLAPAISSGKEIFLYGPSGNGKTHIAQTIAELVTGSVYIPYSLYIKGEVISLYDPSVHRPAAGYDDTPEVDLRWNLVGRPVIVVGGELDLKSLDLGYNPVVNYYEAPLQMKANNGLFIVDDFGRQKINPRELLNRWILPLGSGSDFITFQNGLKLKIPFDQLVIFTTNLDPRTLVDDAFMRRIRYKININHPKLDEYKRLFKKVCQDNSIQFDESVFDYLIQGHYHQKNVRLSSCHCRDLVESIVCEARYHGIKPEMTKESIASAWESYFVNQS